MKNVLYTKYNSTRKPEYQLSTSIIEENDTKYVVKKAMQPKAKAHLMSLPEKRTKLEAVYKDMDIVSCEIKEDTVVFPFVKGKSLLSGISFRDDAIEDIVVKIKYALKKVSQYKEECYRPFEITEEFRTVFGYYFDDKEIQAVCPANLDGILGNFLEQDNGKLCSIDYEWIVDFPVPVRFLDYRAIFYLYAENEKYLRSKVSCEEFLQKFDFTDREIVLFAAMESNLQQEICGVGMAYAYSEKCRKITTSLQQLQEVYAGPTKKQKELEVEFRNAVQLMKDAEDREKDKAETVRKLKRREKEIYATLEQQQAYINELKHMIKNPVYGLKSVVGKLKNRGMSEYTVVSNATPDESWLDAKTHEYREKYAYVRDAEKQVYDKWIRYQESMETYDDVFAYNPKLSVLMSVKALSVPEIQISIVSVCDQIYSNWELCIAVDTKDEDAVKNIIANYGTDKIKVVPQGQELVSATGEYVLYLECGDALQVNALYEVSKAINADVKVDFIYSDEDVALEHVIHRKKPFFKPGWSPDTLMSFWYTGHLAAYRRTVAIKIGGMDASFAEGAEYDFALRFTEQTQRIAHIEKVLYHRIGKSDMPMEIVRKVQESAIARREITAKTESVTDENYSRVVYGLENNPLVSIVIPSKDNYDILKVCIEALTQKSSYRNYEIVLVDNGSCEENREKYQALSDAHDMKYIYQPMKFNFSKMCNIGADASGGEYLIFLNDDIEITQADWIERMVGHASQKHAGAIGAKLLYPGTDLIQHAGVVMYEAGPSHALTKFADSKAYSHGRNRVEYNWSAVTAACMAVKASKFREIDGFNENLMVTFNDVDVCLKLLEKGYYNTVRNDVILYHHESISRGMDHVDSNKATRSLAELELLKYLHPKIVAKDPFYNVNLIGKDESFLDNSYDFVPEKHENDIISSIVEVPESAADMICSIDVVEDIGDKVLIYGWSIISGALDNNDQIWQVVLTNDNHTYVVDSHKDYRPDVAEVYPDELLIEFVGFKSVINKAEIEVGEYQLGVLGEDGCKLVEKILKIS